VGPLWTEILIYRAFGISLKDKIKIPPIRRTPIHVPQKWGPYGNRCPLLSLA